MRTVVRVRTRTSGECEFASWTLRARRVAGDRALAFFASSRDDINAAAQVVMTDQTAVDAVGRRRGEECGRLNSLRFVQPQAIHSLSQRLRGRSSTSRYRDVIAHTGVRREYPAGTLH